MIKRTICLLFLVISCAPLHAALIIQPSNPPTSTQGASASSTLAGMVNGSGLSNVLTTGTDSSIALATTHSNGPIADAYVTGGSGSDYFAIGIPPVITFGLGGVFDDVNSIILWNYNQGAAGGLPQNNSLKTFSLAFFSDAGGTVQIGSTLTGLTINRSLPTTGTGSGPQVAQQVFFPGGINFDGVQVIKLTATDNYFGEAGGAGGDRVGLSEVRFTQLEAIPEPTSLSLWLVGTIAGIWICKRRSY